MENQTRIEDQQVPLLLCCKSQRSDHDDDYSSCHPSWSPISKEAITETFRLYSIAIPLILAGLLTYGKLAISTAFMGRLSKNDLAGGSLAIGFANITGYSILSGLAMGMDAISSQALGAKQYNLVGYTLQRTILILNLFCIPIALLWLYVSPILTFLGQDPSITAVASTYLLYCLPDLFLQSVINPLRIYLRTQNITTPLMLGAGVSLILHAPINYLFVYHYNLGIRGVAMAVAINDFNQLAVILIHLLITGAHRKTWGEGWSSSECFKNWTTILKLAIPNCVSVCLEWWWYELMIILSGILPNAEDAVATMGILIQATALIYIFPSSLSSAVSARVGNELGANNPRQARRAATAGLGCAIFKSLLAMAFAVTMRNVWAGIFTTDKGVAVLVAAALPIIGLCELGNCPQTTLCGVLRGCARPKVGANINLGAFYGVGMPVAVVMGFWFGLGLLGLWMGLLAAQAACAVMLCVAVMRTDWDKEATRAEELTSSGIDTVVVVDDDDLEAAVVLLGKADVVVTADAETVSSL